MPGALFQPEDEAGGVAIPAESRPRLFEAVGRFESPQIEWVEITVKSVLNRVQGMPFNWSINPYRGCSHACSYCLSGDTQILMGNGQAKKLGDLCVDDVTYGTLRYGSYRRYVKTRVLAHWSTKKPAYRVTLEDGTALIAGDDHRFLSDRGWKFVTGTENGRHRRPHLTVNNKLIGVGNFAKPPSMSADYRRGYLCGLIRGDAFLASYPRDSLRSREARYGFRLAMVDLEALNRAAEYLSDFSVPTRSFLFQEAFGLTKALYAIDASGRDRVERITQVVEWPSEPSLDWLKGFLSGIFDAEGGYSGSGVVGIANTDSTYH